jgi:hypothetical protein
LPLIAPDDDDALRHAYFLTAASILGPAFAKIIRGHSQDLPHRVQASIMASTRPCSADSKLSVMGIS